MRQYKDSGIEWIGKIPETWEVMQIRRIMRNRSERNQPDAMVLSLYRDLGIVPKASRDDNHNVTSEDTASYKVVSRGNFVINKMKAWQGSMAVSDYDGIVSPAYYVCSFTRDVYNRYVHYLLRDASYQPEYMRLSTGMRIGQWDLNIDDFLRIKAILPPLPEQQRIADYLDTKCGEIDSLIGLQEQMIEKLKAYKQSVITETVTRGLDPYAKLVPSGIDWIGEIPEGWKVCRIKDMVNMKSGSNLTTEQITNEGSYPVYGGNGLRGYYEEYSNDGDYVLVGRQGALCGNINYASGRFWATDHAVVCYPKREFILTWFGEMLRSMNLGQYSLSAAQPGLSVERIKEKQMPIPPLPEQQAIASYLDEKCADIDRLIALKQQKIEALKDYKKSVIYEAVTGKTHITTA